MLSFSNINATWRHMSPTQKIDSQRRALGLSSWGLVVYRCTYADDYAWSRFKDIFTRRLHEGLERDSAAELAQTLDFIFIEDKDILDQASPDDVRDHFRSWCQATLAQLNIQSQHASLPPTARFNFCILIDNDSLRAVLQGPPPGQPDHDGAGYVTIVNARWELSSPVREDERRDDDGSDDHHVGYLRVCLYTLVPDVYSWLATEDSWDVMYRRPPYVFID